MYANFGMIFSYLISYLVGYFLYFLNKFLYQFNANVLNISLFIWLIMHYQELSISYLSKYLIDTRLFLLIIFLLIVSNFSQKRN